MTIRLELHARDVTQLPETRPAPASKETPERRFKIAYDTERYVLEYDGSRATVPNTDIRKLLAHINEGTSVDWRNSSDSEVQATFQPLNRILIRLNSTPSYQLFLAGFQIGEAIGMFEDGAVQEREVIDSFKYLGSV